MLVVSEIATLQRLLDDVRSRGSDVGFVPTMGALHAGHASLIKSSVRECDFTVVSNFVNPLQFGDGEDFSQYPRDLEGDNSLCEQAGADVVFVPEPEVMFPQLPDIIITPQKLASVLEGIFRPGHLEGVATVLAKLFSIAGRSRAYFGAKDWQQFLVVRQLCQELSMPVEPVACPTVREPDGLALSSRNRYLSDTQRAGAAVLHRSLMLGRQLIQQGETNPARISQAMAQEIKSEPQVKQLDYATAVDADTLNTPRRLSGEVRLMVAAIIGEARLIDNLGVAHSR